VLLLLAAAIFLHPVVFAGRVLLPDFSLRALPWSAGTTLRPEDAWNPLLWDAVAQYTPWRTLAAHHLRAGRVPLWNPHTFCGMPFAANGQSALFYPPNWFFFLLWPVPRAFGWSALFHLWLAGLFTWAYLRTLRLRPPSCAAGAVTFMFCGFLVTWLELPTLVNVATWLPAIFLGLERARQEGRARWAVFGGSAFGLAALAGHLQIFVYVALATLAYSAFRLLTRRHVGHWFLVLGLGGLLASVQLLPSLELARFSHRRVDPSPEGYQAYLARALPVSNLITFFLPDFFGRPTRGDYWGFGQPAVGVRRISPGDYSEFCVYVGLLPLLFAGYAMLFRRETVSHFFTGLAWIAFLLACGTVSNKLFYFYVPGFASSGGPCRIILLTMFALAVLTALGLETLHPGPPAPTSALESPAGRLKRGAVVVGLLLLIFGGCWWYTWDIVRAVADTSPDLIPIAQAQAQVRAQLPRGLLFFALGAVALLLSPRARRLPPSLAAALPWFPALVILADLFTFGHRFNPTSTPAEIYPPIPVGTAFQPPPDYARVLPLRPRWSLVPELAPNPILPPNSALMLGLYDVQGYDSLYLPRYKEFLQPGEAALNLDPSPPENGNLIFVANFRAPLIDLLGVRFVLSRDRLSDPDLRLVEDGAVKIYENTRARPRAFVASQVEAVVDDKELLRRLSSPDFEPEKVVLLEAAGGRRPAAGGRGQEAGGRRPAPAVRLERYEPNRVELVLTQPTEGSAWMVLTDVYFPGWRAYVGDQAVPVQRADYLFRAALLPAGADQLTFVFEPMSFRLGLFLTLLGLLGIGVYGGKLTGA